MVKASFTIKKTAAGIPLLTVTNGNNNEQNSLFKSIADSFNAANPGSYKQTLESIARKYEKTDLNKLVPQKQLSKATDFYVNKNIASPWDPSKQGLNPPAGEFDAIYYGNENPNLLEEWSMPE